MTTLTIPDDLGAQLAAIARLDGLTPDEVAFVQLGDHVARRRRDIEQAYQALNGDCDNGANVIRPDITPAKPMPGALIVVEQDHDGAPADPDETVVDDICDDCEQRHGPDDPECAGQDLDSGSPSEPVEEPEVDEQECQREGCDRTDLKARALCGLHYDRWYRGVEPIAPDGTRSPSSHVSTVDRPAPTAPDGAPSTNGHTAQVATTDDWRCEAARCITKKMARDGKFCPAHSAQVPRLADKLRGRREFSKSGDAEREAVRRLIAGTR